MSTEELPPRESMEFDVVIVGAGPSGLSAAIRLKQLNAEICPGFAATKVVYDATGAVRGIATGDMGIAKDGSHKDSFTRGMELLGKYTLFAEGARGSLSKQLIAKFSLDAKSEPPKFGIGLKEVWEIDPAKHQKGLI